MTLIKKFAMKYYPDEKLVDEEVASSGRAVQMFEIEIEHLSGKEVQERKIPVLHPLYRLGQIPS